MSAPFAEKNFKSFDGYETYSGKLYAPDRYRILESIFKEPGTFSVQGAGLSFPALSFGGGSAAIQLEQFNRFLAFDETTGIVEVEAGMNLGDLAKMTVPKGWYLKVQPGHPSITIGGCLGADVHGKNQFQDLNFKEQVVFLNLYHPHKGFIFCDRKTNPDLFHLTCGGWGLTGVVVSIGIQLGKLKSRHIETETLPITDIFQLPALLKERSATDDLIYSWNDFNSSQNWGKGFLKVGRYKKGTVEAEFNLDAELEILEKAKTLHSEDRGAAPFNVLNRLGVSLLNFAYSNKELRGPKTQTQTLVDFLFPVINKTIYYDLFGKSGFHESQVLIPFEQYKSVMTELKAGLQKFPVPISLASCKLFRGQQELLRFIGEGVVLAFNFPRSANSVRLLEWWDGVVKAHQCLPNISKDSRVPLEVVKACYPHFSQFKTQLHAWDSQRVFQNSLSKRLEL